MSKQAHRGKELDICRSTQVRFHTCSSTYVVLGRNSNKKAVAGGRRQTDGPAGGKQVPIVHSRAHLVGYKTTEEGKQAGGLSVARQPEVLVAKTSAIHTLLLRPQIYCTRSEVESVYKGVHEREHTSYCYKRRFIYYATAGAWVGC